MCPEQKSAELRPHLGTGGLGGLSEPAQIKTSPVSLGRAETLGFYYTLHLTDKDAETSAGEVPVQGHCLREWRTELDPVPWPRAVLLSGGRRSPPVRS